MYFKKSEDFWALWLIVYDFFSEYNRTGVFDQSKIANEHATKFQNKMYIKFQKL